MRVNDYFKSKDLNVCLFWYTSNRSIWNLTRHCNYTLHLDWTNKPCSTSADIPSNPFLVASRDLRKAVAWAKVWPEHRRLGKNSCFPSDRQPSGKHRWLIQPANSERTGGFFCFDASEGWDIQHGFFLSRWHRYGKGLLRWQTGGYNIPWRVLLEASWNPKPSPKL